MSWLRRLARTLGLASTATPRPAEQPASGGTSAEPIGDARREPVRAAATVRVRFEVVARTQWGDSVLVVGGAPALGGWTLERATTLEGSEHPIWTASVELPATGTAEYKYVLRRADGRVDWELGANRVLDCSRGSRTVRDEFRDVAH